MTASLSGAGSWPCLPHGCGNDCVWIPTTAFWADRPKDGRSGL